MEEMESILFDRIKTHRDLSPAYILDSAFQGAEALERVQNAVDEGMPYALAFVDIRMPPGWNGVETIKRIWMVDPNFSRPLDERKLHGFFKKENRSYQNQGIGG